MNKVKVQPMKMKFFFIFPLSVKWNFRKVELEKICSELYDVSKEHFRNILVFQIRYYNASALRTRFCLFQYFLYGTCNKLSSTQLIKGTFCGKCCIFTYLQKEYLVWNKPTNKFIEKGLFLNWWFFRIYIHDTWFN